MVYSKDTYKSRKRALELSYSYAKHDYIEFLELYTAVCMHEGCDIQSVQVRAMSHKLQKLYGVMFKAVCELQRFKSEAYYV